MKNHNSMYLGHLSLVRSPAMAKPLIYNNPRSPYRPGASLELSNSGVTISGKSGHDAGHYQIRAAKKAIEESKK